MASTNTEVFDFVIVGAGPAGCTIAWRLAHSKKQVRVLLIESGGKNEPKEWRIDGDRWVSPFNPELGRGYQTVPQKHVDGRVMSYERGKGLGGSSAVNYSAWNIGPLDDFDEIARLVADEEWKWVNAKERFKRLESYDRGMYSDVPGDYKKYLDPKPEDHGVDGPIKVGFPLVWERQLTAMMDLFIDAGHRANLDTNSGDPIGVAVCPQTAHKGVRTTAADMLVGAPSNLTIVTNGVVAKLVFKDKTATGVSTVEGKTYTATKEVILAAGALDTPKILMLSGIGPADQLTQHHIPIFHEMPYVGQNLRDHFFAFLSWERAEHTNDRRAFYQDKDLQAQARQQWEHDQTGPLSELGCLYSIALLKDPSIYESAEFAALPADRRAHLLRPTVPTLELIVNAGNAEYFVDPMHTPTMANVSVFALNTESRGSVTLQSADPAVPLLFDPNFFAHPFDRRVAVEVVREALKTTTQSAGFAKDTVRPMNVPESDSEDDIFKFWKKNMLSAYHMSGTCKMRTGDGDQEACVDKDFRVLGLQNLRVADMSVVPIMVNNHTQTTAYCVGLMAGDRIVAQYGLDN